MTVDFEKLRTKLQFLRDSLRHLEEIRSRGREAFLGELVLQAAAERYLQIAIEAVLDTASHVIAREGLAVPKTHREAMEVLLREGILPASHRDSFLQMASFRNRLVHLYDDIDPGEVFGILESHLGDFETFVTAVVRRYFPSDEKETP